MNWGDHMNKVYLIDLDGTMFHGNKIIPEAKQFIDFLVAKQMSFIFLTNNATRTKKQNRDHMLHMGFEHIKEEHFFTSSMAASMYVATNYKKRNCFYIGKDGLKESLLEQGFTFVEKDADFVFVGLDTGADYTLYSKALSLLLDGAILMGSNGDRKIPREDGFNVGNGAIVHMLEYASGQTSAHIGKPYYPILEQCLAYYSLRKEEVVIIGDNLETDILLGVNHEVETILVLGGVHDREDVRKLNIQPTQIIDDLLTLIK